MQTNVQTLKSQNSIKIQQKYQKREHRTSEDLFFNVIKMSGILYLILTIVLIPIWVNLQYNNSLIQFPSKCEEESQWKFYLLLGTRWSAKKLQNSTLSSAQKEGVQSWESFYEIYHLCIPVIFLLGCIFIQYKNYLLKREYKKYYIETYSIELSCLPILPSYILIPKLKKYIQKYFKQEYEMIIPQLHIISMSASSSQQFLRRKELQQKIEILMENTQKDSTHFNYELEMKKLKIEAQKYKYMENGNDFSETVWITLQTRYERYVLLRALHSIVERYAFINGSKNKITIRKAPSPSEIIWKNLHQPFYKRIISRFISILICVSLLVFFQLLILFVNTTQYSNQVFTALVVWILLIILKEVIVFITGLQKHRQRSKLDHSLYRKLIKYLYIDITFMVFISSYDLKIKGFQNFSTLKYDSQSSQWYQNTGTIIMLSFLIQIIYGNIRLFLQKYKKKCMRFIKLAIYNYDKKFSQIFEIYNKTALSNKLELPSCYCNVLSVLMMANTYAYSHPIMIPLSSIFCFFSYFCHRKYISTKSYSPYNSDKLDNCAIQSLYFSVIMYLFMCYLLRGQTSFLIVSIIGFLIFLFRNFMIIPLVNLIRKIWGPFIFHPQSQISQEKLTQLMGNKLIQKIQDEYYQIQLAEELCYFMNSEDFQHKQELVMYKALTEQSIERMKREFKDNQECQIRGQLSYKIAQFSELYEED